MLSEKEVNKSVDDALDSLQGVTRVAPQPFFYTRVHARLHRKKEDTFEKISYYITKPSFVTAGIGLIILLNVLALSLPSKPAIVKIEDQERVYSGEEYTMAVSSFYAIENENGE